MIEGKVHIHDEGKHKRYAGKDLHTFYLCSARQPAEVSHLTVCKGKTCGLAKAGAKEKPPATRDELPAAGLVGVKGLEPLTSRV